MFTKAQNLNSVFGGAFNIVTFRVLTVNLGRGRYYVGEVNDRTAPHGTGVEFRRDGTKKYEGEWLNGRRHGKGIWFRGNGNKLYESEWLNGRVHGEGIWFCDNGNNFYVLLPEGLLECTEVFY